MKPGRGGSKAIDGYPEEAAAGTPGGSVPSTATRAPAPGPPGEEALPAALQAEARAPLETQLASMTSTRRASQIVRKPRGSGRQPALAGLT